MSFSVTAASLLGLVVASSLHVREVSRKGPFDGARWAGCGVPAVSTGMSVPRPRLSGLDLSDSALLAASLHEAPIGFAFIGLDSRIRRVNPTMARLPGREPADSVRSTPAQAWPPPLSPPPTAPAPA